jgi:DHA1 family inner membrane transport protein
VAALGTGLFGMGAAIGSYSGFVPLLLRRDVPPELAGLGMSLFLLALFLAVLPSDWATRYLSIEEVTLIGLAIGTGGALLAGVPSLAPALLSRTLLGVGQGAVFVTSMKYAGVRTPAAQTARTQGILGGVFTLGFAVALAVTPTLLALLGPWAPSLSATFVVAGGLWTLRLPAARNDAPPTLGEYAAVFRTRTGLALGFANMATFGFLIVATTWYTDLMGRFPGLPVTAVLAGFALMTVVGRMAGGWIESRLGSRTTVSTSLLGLTGALCALLAAIHLDSSLLLAAGVLGTGLGFGIPFGPLFSFAFTELTADPGTVLVEMMVLGNGGALVYPWLIGLLLADTASYFAGFVVMTLTVVGVWTLWQTALPGHSVTA